jgi:cell division protein FtsQ
MAFLSRGVRDVARGLVAGLGWHVPALAAALIVALAVAYFGWFRDSGLVAVERVRVEGVSGADHEQIVTALTDAAEGMTTLHVREDQLEAAVASFPTVASVTADADFPHGLVIDVDERRPALVAVSDGGEVPVAADGTALPGIPVDDLELPRVEVEEIPPSGRLEGDALEQALILGAAPEPLAPLIESASMDERYGVVVELRAGIPVRFGTSEGAKPKWAAAAAVLADPNLTAISYLDVRAPGRPAVGGAA